MTMPPRQDARRSSPSTQRNREPIAQVLQGYLNAGSHVLEIAAGTGEHAVYLSKKLAAARWWPSDISADALGSIDAWREETGPAALQPAILLDVSRPVADSASDLAAVGARPAEFDAIVCINMIHISPWQATQGLMRTAGALLRDGGILYLYGPYKRNGLHTAQSNAGFDADLQSRDPGWGVRDLDDVCTVAIAQNLNLLDVVPMPANNLSVILQKHVMDDLTTVSRDWHKTHD